MHLFHFSDDPTIKRFVPRAVDIPAQRTPGMDWLNGPLVWAIEEAWQALYLFPRDCPRILLIPTHDTTDQDRERWLPNHHAAMVAHIETAWLDRVHAAHIHRYELPVQHFEDLRDAGMWVSRREVEPLTLQTMTNLPAALAAMKVELRALDTLSPLKQVWSSTLHASGIRLRNARDW